MKRSSKTPAPKARKTAPKKVRTPKRAPEKPAAPAPSLTTTPEKPRDPRLPAAGTTATRAYKGKTLKVKYLEDGVEVDGRAYASLSAAARAVTGAPSINGPLWFRLAGPRTARVAPATTTPSAKRTKKPNEPKIGNGNDIGTPAGQRTALAALGLTKPANATSATKQGKAK